MIEKRYAMAYRPPSFSTVPLGYLRVEHVDKTNVFYPIARHGIIFYDRVLSQLETEAYELREILDGEQEAQCVECVSAQMAENRDDWLSMLDEEKAYVRSAVHHSFQAMYPGQQSKPVLADPDRFIDAVLKRLREMPA